MRVCPECFSLFADQETCPQDGIETVDWTEVLVGLNLGPYVVRSMISEGGMGVVYAGEHPTLGRRIALKVLRPELSLRDDIVERFTQEARAVNTIGHANIVNIYDFGKTPFGTFYIVMEYIEGKTLRTLLDTGGPQPLERVRFVLESISLALAAAHNKGFLHRDVKPENIMVGQRSSTEFAKLLDFGIAKLISAGNTTAASGAMGTPQYMSPEQLEDKSLDHRSDIFAFGCVIYELLTGQVPFSGSSQGAVRQAQLTRNPPPPSLCRRDIHLSSAIDNAVLQTLELNPDQRPQKIEVFLQHFLKGYELTLLEQQTGHQIKKRRNLKVPIFATLFAITLGIIIAWGVLRFSDKKTPLQKRTRPRIGKIDGKNTSLTKDESKKLARDKLTRAINEGYRDVFLWSKEVPVEALRDPYLNALKTHRASLAANVLGNMKSDAKTMNALRKALLGATPLRLIAISNAILNHDHSKATRKQLSLLLRRTIAKAKTRRGGRLIELEAAIVFAKLAHSPEQLVPLKKQLQPLGGPRWIRLLSTISTKKGASFSQARSRAIKDLIQQASKGAAENRLYALEFLADKAPEKLKRFKNDIEDLKLNPNGSTRARALAIHSFLGDLESIKKLLDYSKSVDTEECYRSLLELALLDKTNNKLKNEDKKLLEASLMNGLHSSNRKVSLAAAIGLLID